MMFRDTPVSLTDDLWKDLIVPYQLPQDMYQWMQVSRAASLFYRHRDTWKKAIEARFGIPCSALNEFENIVAQLTGITDIDFQLIYRRLHVIHHGSEGIRTYIPFINLAFDTRMLTNPGYYFSLLACCLDNIDVAEKLLHRDFYHTWQKISISGDCVNLVTQFFPRLNAKIIYQINGWYSVRAHATIQYVVAKELPTHRERDECVIHLLHHAKPDLVNYLIKHAELYNIKIDGITFDRLTENDNLPLSFFYDFLGRAVAANPSLTINGNFFNQVRYRLAKSQNTGSTLSITKNIIQLLMDNNVKFNGKLRSNDYFHLLNMREFTYFQYLLANDMLELPFPVTIISLLIKNELISINELSCWLKLCGTLDIQQGTNLLETFIVENQFDLFVHLLKPENDFPLTFSSRLFFTACDNRVVNSKFLDYLLRYHITDECKPDQKLLDHATEQHRTEQMRLLLQPELGLRPSVKNFNHALYGHYHEIVNLFMDETRNFGFSFTPELFSNVSHYSQLSHPNSSIRMAEYMLQPQFGLVITHELFDNLYHYFNRQDADPTGQKTVEFLLYLLDKCQLTLTQKKFESLFCFGYWYVAKLPAIRPDQFAHFRATNEMLESLIKNSERKHYEYVDILFEPHLGLHLGLIEEENLLILALQKNELKKAKIIIKHFAGVSAKVLSTALENELSDNELLQAIVDRCEVAPSLKSFAQYAAKGDLHLVGFILQKYAMPMDQLIHNEDGTSAYLTILEFIYKCYSLKNVLFLLNLAKSANIIGPDQLPFCLNKENTYGIEGNLVLLDPQYNLQFKPEHLTKAFQTSPDLKGLFASDFAIKECINLLIRKSEDAAKQQFRKAYQQSPTQCLRVATYALCHPKQYHISSAAREVLLEFMLESLKTLEELSITEQREIGSMVRTTHFVLLDGEYFGQQLAHQLVPR